MLVNAIVLHLIADWIFQNDWIARNKSSLLHPAAWVHGFIHLAFLVALFPPLIAIAIAASHVLIDTRSPVKIWQRLYRQTTEGEYAIHVAIWLDQVFHIAILALAVQITKVIS